MTVVKEGKKKKLIASTKRYFSNNACFVMTLNGLSNNIEHFCMYHRLPIEASIQFQYRLMQVSFPRFLTRTVECIIYKMKDQL